jgi:hypothetical protein
MKGHTPAVSKHRIPFVVIAVALAMLISGTASGAPEKNCDDPKWQEHPACVTTSTQPPTTQQCPTVVEIDAAGGRVEFECDWTPAHDEAALSGHVGVRVLSGEMSRLVIFVRDSNPGDICALEQWDRPAADEFEAAFPLIVGNETYWGAPTHWCSRFDPVSGTREDSNGDPLNLFIGLRGKKGTVIEVTLTPGQSS